MDDRRRNDFHRRFRAGFTAGRRRSRHLPCRQCRSDRCGDHRLHDRPTGDRPTGDRPTFGRAGRTGTSHPSGARNPHDHEGPTGRDGPPDHFPATAGISPTGSDVLTARRGLRWFVTEQPLPRSCVQILGTTCVVIAADPDRLTLATMSALREIDAIDHACSRFRDDSDLSRVNASAGHAVAVSTVLLDALEVAVRAAMVTDGDVDPTIGRAIRLLGYDCTFADLPIDGPPVVTVRAASQWPQIKIDRLARTITVPAGVQLDLGATAKALAADRAAAAAAAATGSGVLVSIGGDLAAAGPAPLGGWPIALADRHDDSLGTDGPTVAIESGGLATSSTTARRWHRGGVELHHLIDPRTGRPAPEVWRTVTVAAASCVDANIASTAAIIRGASAPEWLGQLGLWARLVSLDGAETLVEPPDRSPVSRSRLSVGGSR